MAIIKKLSSVRNLLLLAVVAIFTTGLVIPFIGLVNRSLEIGPAGSNAYVQIFNNAGYMSVIFTSAIIAVTTTIFTIALAYPLAYYIWNSQGTLKFLFLGALIVPFFTSIVVKNFSWTVILENSGPINKALMALGITSEPIQLLFTRFAVIIAMVHYLLPIAVVPIYVALTGIDRSLIKASRSLGAGRARTFTSVTFPLSGPGVATSSVTVFVLAAGFYVTPALLGGRGDRMVANLIDDAVNKLNRLDTASGLAIVVGVVVLISIPIALRQISPRKEGAK